MYLASVALVAGCGRMSFDAIGAPDADVTHCVEQGQLLINGGFEEPSIGIGGGAYSLLASEVPGWETEIDPNDEIEVWESGHEGVEAAGGAQFIELNGVEAADVFQDVATVPGTVLRWALDHRGRWDVDRADVRLGPPGALENQVTLATDTNAWRRYEGHYPVPPGQEVTRLQVRSIWPTGSYGNLIDELSLVELVCSDP